MISVGKLRRRMGLALVGVAVWELVTRRAEQHRLGEGSEYWRRYYDDETLRRGDELRQVVALRSAGVTIHLDVYPQPDPGAAGHGLQPRWRGLRSAVCPVGLTLPRARVHCGVA